MTYPVLAATEVQRPYRFHILGLVHLPVSRRYMGCAFTQKIEKMCRMLLELGHEVYLYGAEGSDAPCTEFFQTHSLADIARQWGDGDNRFRIGYDWRKSGFRHDFNQNRTTLWHKFNKAASAAILSRKRDDDFLLLMQGSYQKPVADEVDIWLTAEPGIGYRGSYARFRAFESSYLMNFTYGSANPGESINGDWYHRVIPNYFDPQDFPYKKKKDDYFFFIGRLITRKGVHIAVQASAAAGKKLILAGQESNEINVRNLPGHCEFVGYVEPEERARLMSEASAVFVPTMYLEAFGGVNVEAQICGTPVITTNFGVFPETVVHGVTGFRCDMLDDFAQAAKSVGNLQPKTIRAHAERYLMGNVMWEYQKWWDDLYRLYLSAKDSNVKGWSFVSDD